MNKKRRSFLPSMSLLTLGLLCLIQIATAGVITGDITTSTTTVGANSQLNFEANLASTIPSGGKLVMVFSSGVNLT